MPVANTRKNILITVDLEDWYQVENLRPWFPPDTWPSQQQRIESNTHRLLDLFDSYEESVKATFFVLGWVADKYPELIREIGKRGHEIASHGYNHVLCNQMEKRDLVADLKKSKQLLEDTVGTTVAGYRAPSFSISDEVLDALVQCGYQYDSSHNSFERHGRYGTIKTYGHPKKGAAILIRPNFIELPISNLNIMNQTIPWGGGGYFRFFPPTLFLKGIRYILNRTGIYMFYMHPWEIDPNQPKVTEAKGQKAWRHYLNLDKTYPRLDQMISAFQDMEFSTCSQYVKSLNLH